jgi:hypothetical protein
MAKKQHVKAVKCPKCKDEIMLRVPSGDIEVFECQGCKFKVEKKK